MDCNRKIEILGESAQFDLCAACGGTRVRSGVEKWIYPAVRPDGQKIFMLKILMTNSCRNDCRDCAVRRSRDMRRTSFEPEELVRLPSHEPRLGIMSKKTSVKTRNARKRAPDRVVMDGLPTRTAEAPDAGTHIYALYHTLCHLGKRVTEPWVAGITGSTWRIVFTAPNCLSPETPYVGLVQLTVKALETMGFKCRYEPVGDAVERARQLILLLRDGKPVITHNYPEPHRWGALVGFNRRRRKLYYWDACTQDDALELDEAEVLERPDVRLLYPVAENACPTRKEMFLHSLAEAVEWSTAGLQTFDSTCSQLYYSGFTAYQYLNSWLRTQTVRLSPESEAATCRSVVAAVASGRRLAASFLRQGARLLKDAPVEILEAAGESYGEVAERFEELRDKLAEPSPTVESLTESGSCSSTPLRRSAWGLATSNGFCAPWNRRRRRRDSPGTSRPLPFASPEACRSALDLPRRFPLE